ncbi:uncharacterized protein [Eurosta solidaginis]|uniref:uncharacterized protein n=1 Tax=Eurosta solidaginis TaxID=178769 RepID=UPI0035307FFF
MDCKKCYAFICLTFAAICNLIGDVDGKPTVTLYDGYVDTIDREYIVPYQQPITDYHLSRLRRGYYYVEDGFITAIPESAILAKRRADATATASSSSAQSSASNAAQLAKYKRTHGKRKKLFVPNLFG